MTKCSHTDQVHMVPARTGGCEECMGAGTSWVALRLCRTCGHVGCCDSSTGRHARAHFETTGHPIIEPLSQPKSWAWCYVDDCYLDPAALKTPG
ncbi:MAG TPA: UBP-type zinc finger domain-containing protein [Micropepsaceae bacterium]|nr:UBP-type zinc finger domain-containing protein [Micropepsaceae bacterium]